MGITINWWLMVPSIGLLVFALAWKVADVFVELDIPLFPEGGHILLIPAGLGCVVPIWFPDEENE